MPRISYSDEHLFSNGEFTLELSQKLGITHQQARKQLKLTLELLAEVLAREGIGGANLAPFGLIKLRIFPAREGHGILPGNPAFYRLVLKPSKAVKRAVKHKPITEHDQAVAAGRVESRTQKQTATARGK